MLSQPFSVLDKLAAIERPPTFYNWIPSNDPQDSLFVEPLLLQPFKTPIVKSSDVPEKPFHMILGSVPTDLVRQHHIILSSSR